MSKTYKAISYHDRMNNPVHTPKITFVKREHFQFISEPCVNEDTGRIYHKSSKKLVENNRFAKFKVVDFCLENLEAIGALDKLKTASLSLDKHSAMKQAENKITSIINNDSNNN